MILQTPVRRLALTALVTLVLPVAASQAADEIPKMPEMPKPGPEHVFLQQYVGQWKTETEAVMEPGKPAIKTSGFEKTRAIGGFWTVSDIEGKVMDKPFMGSMTLGYDLDKKQYKATWVDSMTGRLWDYEKTSFDPATKTLTLESEGTCPGQPDGKVMQFRDTLTFKDKNHKQFSSAMKGDDGQWVTMMTSQSTRVK